MNKVTIKDIKYSPDNRYVSITDQNGDVWSSQVAYVGTNKEKLVSGATLDLNLKDAPNQYQKGYFSFPRFGGGKKSFGRSEEERTEIIRQSSLGYAIETFKMQEEKKEAKDVIKLAEIYVNFVKGKITTAEEKTNLEQPSASSNESNMLFPEAPGEKTPF